MRRAQPAAARGPARGGGAGCTLASPPRSLGGAVDSTTCPSGLTVPQILPDQSRSAPVVNQAMKRGGVAVIWNPPPPIAAEHRKRVGRQRHLATDHNQLTALAAQEVAGTAIPSV